VIQTSEGDTSHGNLKGWKSPSGVKGKVPVGGSGEQSLQKLKHFVSL